MADGVECSAWVSRSEGGSLGVAESLTPGDELADASRISIRGTGGALVVWNRDEGRHKSMAASSYWNGAWSPSQLVDSDMSSGLWDLMIGRNF